MAETTTTRLGLVKPTSGTGENVDVTDHLNLNWDKIDAAIGATVCTSGTRPASPYDGQIIRESDTRRIYVRNNTQSVWEQVLSTNSSFLGEITQASGSISTTGNLNVDGDAFIDGYTQDVLKRISTSSNITADTTDITTTETVAMTHSATLQAGRWYRVTANFCLGTTIANTVALVRMREDNLTGTVRMATNYNITLTSSAGDGQRQMIIEFQAVASASKTFVITLIRNGGTGAVHIDAGTDHPAWWTVEYIRG